MSALREAALSFMRAVRAAHPEELQTQMMRLAREVGGSEFTTKLEPTEGVRAAMEAELTRREYVRNIAFPLRLNPYVRQPEPEPTLYSEAKPKG